MPTSQQTSRINDTLHIIHRDISADLSGRKLAAVAAYSEQHFHRIFKHVVGETLVEYIRRIRLEQAANQLMFDPESTVLEIAEKCGFISLASFGHAFKKYFRCSPGQWRNLHNKLEHPPYLADPEITAGYQRIQDAPLPHAELVTLPARSVAYIRHRGYGRSIRFVWQTLQAWAAAEQRPFEQQIGLHHSNPIWTPLDQCRYVACIGIDKPILRRGLVNTLTIPGGLHARFDLQGRYGELLPYISKIEEQWLPKSGCKMQTTPAFVHYQKNHFLEKDEHFSLGFYLPISLL